MKKLLAISIVALLLFNCKKSDDNSGPRLCTYDPCALKAPASEIQSVQDYLTANSITATQHCSGLFYKIETVGTGDTANACSYVRVKYIGKLTNGTVFDQKQGADTYANFLSNLIRAWINGIPLIKVGGKIHLYIPPSLGYGSQANGSIPANSILIFEVELVDVE
jgi:FKBP-type peptidyl-prolyl cis-trans isomerase FkpA